jgi:hypothetical protein
MNSRLALLLACALAFPSLAATAPAPKPLRILLVTGGCCHDYAAQKDLLKQGLEARAHVVVEHMHTVGAMNCTDLPCELNSAAMRFTRLSSVPTSQREPGALAAMVL